MEPAARLYVCAHCRISVLVCSQCDHGNRYCKNCAREVRKCKQRDAAQRYQESPHGRSIHAKRQRRYRERQRRNSQPLEEKVTHQASPLLTSAALLPPEVAAIEVDASQQLQQSQQCHFCGRHCDQAVRIDFLRRRIRRLPRLTDQKEPYHARDP